MICALHRLCILLLAILPFKTFTQPHYPTELDCALPLTGNTRLGVGFIAAEFPGRLRVNCISYVDVNEAFQIAREKVGLFYPPQENSVYSQAHLGTVLQETARILGKRFSLTREEIVLGLPQIDVSRTNVNEFCPNFLKVNQECKVERYRRYSGTCNNLRNPTWGSTRRPFRRLLLPVYADDISEPRRSISGKPLPNPRLISAHVHRDEGPHNHAVTFMFVAWGQLIDHDLTFTAETKDPKTRHDPNCCHAGGAKHPNCLAVDLPTTDPFYSLYGQTCMNVLRSLAGTRDNCHIGPRVQINTLTPHLDANFIYGSDAKTAASLRLFRYGLMRTLPVFKGIGLKPLLPLKEDLPDDGCIRHRPDVYCFLAGDSRVNEQVALAVLHTVLVRHHNQIAIELGRLNAHWGDEEIYQETRHIMIAIVQHITFNEFLPVLLGKDTVEQYDLQLKQQGYWDGYDATVDPTVSTSFMAAAFRFGHSLLPGVIERWSPGHRFIGAQRLSEVLKRPYDLFKPGWLDQYLMGLVNQVAEAMDDGVTQEVTNHLFQQPFHRYGLDLATINLQRGREHGLPGYNAYRHVCGLPPAGHWSEMLRIMRNSTVKRYHDVYEHPDDVDLWSGGISEKPLQGSILGPTFSCIIAQTFRDLRRGDRFWYENSGWPSSFTYEQLQEIRKVQLSRLLCDAGDNLEIIQAYSMTLADFYLNQRVSCKNQVLPRMDLSKWKAAPSSRNFRTKSIFQEVDDNDTEDGHEDYNSVEPLRNEQAYEDTSYH